MIDEVGHNGGWLILNIDHCTNTIGGETEERKPVGIVTLDLGQWPEEADHEIHPHEQLTRARYLTGAQRDLGKYAAICVLSKHDHSEREQ